MTARKSAGRRPAASPVRWFPEQRFPGLPRSAAGESVSVEAVDGAGLASVALVGLTASFDPEASCARRKTAVDAAPDWLSASLGQGSSIQAAHPAIAIAGSTMSRASARPNDRPAILMAASSGGDGDCRAA